MKHFIRFSLMLALIAGVTTVFSQEKPKIVFERLSHDFGTFLEAAGVQTTEFVFKNEGTVPLILNNVRASCGCTTPKWTREPVAPGKSGTIQVSYNPKNRPGNFTKAISVQSNADKAVVNLSITGVVEQREKTVAELYPRMLGALRVKTPGISFAKIKRNEIKTKSLELVNDTDKPINVELKTVPKHIKAEVSPGVVPAKGKSIVKVTYDATQRDVYGYVSDRIYLIIDGEENYRNSLSINATVEEDFSSLTAEELANSPKTSFDSNDFDFGNIKQGDKVEHNFTMTNNGNRDLIIRDISSSCGCTAVTPEKKVIPSGDSVPIKVVFDSKGRKGRQSKTITIITNDPKQPTSTLRITSNVQTES